MTWETVIGLEIHSQLKTKSKIFSGASTAFGATANTQACAVDLGFLVCYRFSIRRPLKWHFGLVYLLMQR